VLPAGPSKRATRTSCDEATPRRSYARGGAFSTGRQVPSDEQRPRSEPLSTSNRDANPGEFWQRYLARAPLSLERMSLLPDGRIAYELRHAWQAGRTHVLLEPLQLLARLAALVPPPRHPLLRFHGAFAPNSPLRSRVVPTSPPRLAGASAEALQSCAHQRRHEDCERSKDERPPETGHSNRHGHHVRDDASAASAIPANPPATRQHGREREHERERERERERGGDRPRARWYIDWATLLRRVYDVDALACPCGGRLRFVEVVDNERDARAFLASRTTGPELAERVELDPMRCDTLRTDAAIGLDDEPDYHAVDPPCDHDGVDPPPDYDAVEPPPDSS
jgi:hypothetical protein